MMIGDSAVNANNSSSTPRGSTAVGQQTGVALITVLLVVFLATVAATSLASLQQLTIRRSTLFQHQQQARLYTLGAEEWAIAILRRDLEDNQIDHLAEDWATLPPALPIQGGAITGRIADLQGRFNINNLLPTCSTRAGADSTGEENEENTSADDADNDADLDPDDPLAAEDENGDGDLLDPQDPFAPEDEAMDSVDGEAPLNPSIDGQQGKLLLGLLEFLDIDANDATVILQSIADWLDSDLEPRFPDGAEDSEYVGRTPPYLAAHRCLSSVSELRLIKGIDAEVYAKLAPHVTALPTATALNVNTLQAPILAALSRAWSNQPMSLEEAEARLEDVPANGYRNVSAFLDAHGFVVQTPEQLLTVNSDYFAIAVDAQVGDGRAQLHSILQRSGAGKSRVLMQSFSNDSGALAP